MIKWSKEGGVKGGKTSLMIFNKAYHKMIIQAETIKLNVFSSLFFYVQNSSEATCNPYVPELTSHTIKARELEIT